MPDGNDDRDYGATGADEVFNLDTQDAQDTERFTVNASSISGFVYHDADASGGFNVGDNALVGETVSLTGTTIFGEAITRFATSVAGGVYSFSNVAPGTYTLTETQPAGYVDAAETVGTLFGGAVSNALGSNTISGLTIPAGNNSGTDYNFGEVLASSLSGFVYSDLNNDGIVQGGETLLDGVNVQITGTDFLGQAFSTSTTTVGGAYSAVNLRPGTYTITETQPGGFFDGRETVGSQASGIVNNAIDSNTISTIALAQNVNGAGNNFGELAQASLSGIVFDDRDNDGNVDPGESGIGGATISLSGTDDRGNPVSVTLATQPDGTYNFPALRPGTYTITETQPAGFLDGLDVAGTLGGSVAVNDVISGIVLGAGQDGTNNRFGELTPSSLSGVVFSDTNNDGTQQVGEAGLAGVVVTLTGTDDLGNLINTPGTTLAGGGFSFGNLRPGSYTITETQPAGLLDGIDTAGTLGGSTAVNDVISGIVVAPAQNGTGNTFGELPGISLSGNVFIDADNDGVFDLGETGQVGVTITLTGTDDIGNAVSLSTMTLADGSYSFLGLRPSNAAGYTVTETQPAGLLDGRDTVGNLGGSAAINDVISGVVLGAGATATDYNFGELRAASLAGLVFDDRDNDGVQDIGENGIGGVSITLSGTDDLGSAVSTTLGTQPDGSYSFIGLRPGTYTITETTPAGFLDGIDTIGTPGGTTANDVFSNIVLTEGTIGTANNFAELTAATLSGNVFNDTNNDGVRDLGEAGIITNVTLTGTNDLGNAVSLTIPTAADGTYSFGTLRPGTYTVSETQPAGFLDGRDTAGSLGGTLANDNVSAITVNAADAGTDYNFGELRAASLSGFVFDDRNNDGVQGVGENGIGGVSIMLSGTNDLGNPVSVTLTTQPDGSYSFIGLRPGTYTITETTPAGFLDGIDTIGTPGGTTANDVFSNIVLTEGTDGTANNFAELTAATLSGNVFNDTNNDGVRDPGETGILGVTITLTGTDDLGNPVNLTTMTLANGTYSFGTLRPGTYTVSEAQPAGFFDGVDAVGSLGGTLANDSVSAITVTPADSGTDYNFGELRASSLSGFVFDDRNNDGLQGVGENGIGGVTIMLTGIDDLAVAVSLTLTTQPDGSYSFIGLRPGTYSIAETTPAGFLDGTDTIGTLGGTSANDLFSNIVLPAATDGTANNFAELTPATLNGNVFIDADNDGVRDAGEAGILGVTITLSGTDDLGNAVSTTTMTLADGTYSFGTLRPGTYTVSETQPAGLLDGRDTAGSLGGTVGADSIGAITLNAANAGTNYNFGELRAGTLSGTVFQDTSNNGTQEVGEPGLGGVTITLTGTDDLGAPVSVTMTSSVVDGSYTFPGLRPGNYTITETQPAGFLDGRDTVGTAGGTLANDVISTITLAENQVGSGYNFGEILASTLSGRVFSDLNNNGVIDLGEGGISGVSVTLSGTNDLGQPVSLTAPTDINGDYTFLGLRPGNYSVTETQPAGFLDGRNTVGTGAGGTTVNNPPTDVISGLVLPTGTMATGYNFGELAPASISGNVYQDFNDDGLRGPGEGRINGAIVRLSGTNDLGQVVNLTLTTTADGSFNFGNLRPGSYSLIETQPAGFLDGKDTVGTAGGTQTNDRFSNIAVSAGQSGSSYLFGERVANVPTTPDLYVLKTDNLTTVRPGSRLTYVITGGNAGDATASGVILSDMLPNGVRFVSASSGGVLSGGKVTWNLGDIAAGGTFRVTVTVVVEQQVGGRDLINTVTVKDRFGSPNDPTPKNNRAEDRTLVEAFAFDSFNNFSRDRFNVPGLMEPERSIDVWRQPPITPAPVYSGEADPGATLSIELFSANGDRIGSQSVVVDSGGNWIVSFPSSIMRDYPASVRITELRAPYTDAGAAGRNLRNFFVPALHAGHFSFGGYDSTVLDPRVTAPLLGGLELGSPFALGEAAKYNVELLPNTAAPNGR
ncbi:MAG: SdrD B-like domain-containing protein [Chthoniobacteraceae bacterium]